MGYIYWLQSSTMIKNTDSRCFLTKSGRAGGQVERQKEQTSERLKDKLSLQQRLEKLNDQLTLADTWGTTGGWEGLERYQKVNKTNIMNEPLSQNSCFFHDCFFFFFLACWSQNDATVMDDFLFRNDPVGRNREKQAQDPGVEKLTSPRPGERRGQSTQGGATILRNEDDTVGTIFRDHVPSTVYSKLIKSPLVPEQYDPIHSKFWLELIGHRWLARSINCETDRITLQCSLDQPAVNAPENGELPRLLVDVSLQEDFVIFFVAVPCTVNHVSLRIVQDGHENSPNMHCCHVKQMWQVLGHGEVLKLY